MLKLDPTKPFKALMFNSDVDLRLREYATLEELYEAVSHELPTDWNTENSVLFLEMEDGCTYLQAALIQRTWNEHDMYRTICG